MKKSFFLTLASISLSFLLAVVSAEASNFTNFTTIYDTDFTSAGYGGMRDIGTGTIALSGVSGTVGTSYLYWHGPSNSTDPQANADVTFNGTPITGTSLGLSSDNCWGFNCSQAYRADVSSLVTGNGSYSLDDFVKSNGANINGVSLVTFFDDGDGTNNRDVVIFDGNDSNISNAYDADGWNITLSGINYSSGSAYLQLHVSDGQTFPDDAILINGMPFLLSGAIFSGDSTPAGTGGPDNGSLWDIITYDITSYLSVGMNTLTITTEVNSDCLSGIVALIDLPAGAAPPVNTVPEPSTFVLFGGALLSFVLMRKKQK